MNHDKFEDLRKRAEKLLCASVGTGDRQPAAAASSTADILELIHEIEVHQTELELQNEELERAQNEISALHHEFEDLFEFSPSGYVTLNAKGLISRANLTAALLLGTERGRLMQRSLLPMLAPSSQDAFVAAKRSCGQTGERQVLDVQLAPSRSSQPNHARKTPPRWLHMEISAAPDKDGNPAQWRVALIDITKRKEMQAQLAQADRLASLGLVAASVGHEINNPLTYLLYNLETVVEDLQQIFCGYRRLQVGAPGPGAAPDEAEYSQVELDDLLGRANKALEGAERIRSISHNLGSFSRFDDESTEPVCIHRAVESARDLAHNEIKHRARLIIDVDSAPPVLGSEGKLSQVFLNLLINAAHAIEEGNAEDNYIRVLSSVDGNHVCIEVSDTGCGIPAEHINELFDPFFTTKALGEGSGLGLAISKKIVIEMGGEITCESEVGKGTTFWIRLPIIRNNECRSPATDGADRLTTATGPRGRILVVDDEDLIRDIMIDMLGEKHEVVAVASGSSAQEVLEKDPNFDLIILDLMMPKVSGMQLHQWLTQTHPQLAERVIFMTGGVFTPAASAYLATVNNMRLEKPFHTATFQKVVNEIIAGRSRKIPTE